jgi:hypothetical protein
VTQASHIRGKYLLRRIIKKEGRTAESIIFIINHSVASRRFRPRKATPPAGGERVFEDIMGITVLQVDSL